MNAGFKEIVRRTERIFDCYIFHDIDTYPEDNRNLYGCYKLPKHVAAYVSKTNYRYRSRAYTHTFISKLINSLIRFLTFVLITSFIQAYSCSFHSFSNSLIGFLIYLVMSNWLISALDAWLIFEEQLGQRAKGLRPNCGQTYERKVVKIPVHEQSLLTAFY